MGRKPDLSAFRRLWSRHAPVVDSRAMALDAADEALAAATLVLSGGDWALLSGEPALRRCALILGLAQSDAAGVVAALARGDESRAADMEALEISGKACNFAIRGKEGSVAVSGGASGAIAFLRLAPGRLAAAAAAAAEQDRAAIDAYPYPAWIVGPDGATVMANRAWLQAVGAADLPAALSAGLTLDSEAHDLARVAALGGGSGGSVRSLDLPHGRRVMRIWAEPLTGGGAAIWTVDVTDARSASRTARLKVEALDLMLSQVSDAVAVFDEDRRLTRHNPAFAALWSLEAAWLAERPCHSEWLDRLRQARRLPQGDDYAVFKARELARHEHAEPSEAIWRLPDGRTLRLAAAPHPEGGLILAFADVTDELRLTTQFNHLLQVQQATLDKLTDAVAVFGADARLKLHNDAFKALWNLPVHALVQAPHFDDLVEFCVARLHDLGFWRDLKGRIADPDPHVRTAAAGEALTGDGRRLAWQSRPLPDGATLVGFADVTDARRIEEALQERQGALDEAERLKSEFVGAVSRELRTPLTTILGYAELLDRDEEGLAPRSRGRVSAIRVAASHLARSIEDILDIAELDAGEVRLRPADLDVGALLAATAARWSTRVAEAGADLIVAAQEGARTIQADGRRLAQVLDHLVDNALARTPAGGAVTLSETRDAGEARLMVSDTGPVIPYVVQARIFERHGSTDSGTTRLGLALVKGLVELHGGWVTVESAPGAGAVFTCHLPEYAEPRDAPDDDPRREGQDGQAPLGEVAAP